MDRQDIDILKIIISYCKKINASINRFGEQYDIFINDDDYFQSVSMSLE
jgi:hypothetical protein